MSITRAILKEGVGRCGYRWRFYYTAQQFCPKSLCNTFNLPTYQAILVRGDYQWSGEKWSLVLVLRWCSASLLPALGTYILPKSMSYGHCMYHGTGNSADQTWSIHWDSFQQLKTIELIHRLINEHENVSLLSQALLWVIQSNPSYLRVCYFLPRNLICSYVILH